MDAWLGSGAFLKSFFHDLASLWLLLASKYIYQKYILTYSAHFTEAQGGIARSRKTKKLKSLKSTQ